MIVDKCLAKKVVDLMHDIAGQIEASIGIVRGNSSSEQLLAYKRAVGKVIYELYEEVLEPLYKEHPTLRPPGRD